MLERLHEGLLKHVLGIGIVLSNVFGQAVDLARVPVHQLTEGRNVSLASLCQQPGLVEHPCFGGGRHSFSILPLGPNRSTSAAWRLRSRPAYALRVINSAILLATALRTSTALISLNFPNTKSPRS